jgi:hypothetical protein
MADEWWISMYLEEIYNGPIELVTWHLPGGTEKNDEKF